MQCFPYPEKREKDLNIIIDETDRLNALVNDLLDLSKMQAGECELNISEYDIVKNIKYQLLKYKNLSMILICLETNGCLIKI